MELTKETKIDDIVLALFPEWRRPPDIPEWADVEVEGIEFGLLRQRIFGHRTPIGVELKVIPDWRVHTFRRVMAKEGKIDLEVVRRKFEELKPIAAAARTKMDEQRKKDAAREAARLSLAKSIGLELDDRLYHEADKYRLSLLLTREQAEKVYTFVKHLRGTA